MSFSLLPDKDIQRAAERFLTRTQPVSPPPPADAHALMQQFGGPDATFTGDESVIHVIPKPCVLYEWTIDAHVDGDVQIGLEWSDWRIPRIWLDMVGPGNGPALVGASNANGIELHTWAGPVQFHRRDAIRITVLQSSVSYFTLGLYMRELPNFSPTVLPTEVPPVEP